MNALQMTMTKNRKEQAAILAKAMMWTLLLVVAYMILNDFAIAATTDEFSAASTKFEGWVTGSLGKLAGFVALAVGSVVAAVKKDWSWFFGAVILSVGVGIIVTVINASFAATI
jgi:hypothetical protein